MADWYQRRDELEYGMVFTSCWGTVKLQDRVEGDGSQWNALSWTNGGWANEGATVEPGDLEDKIADPEAA
ncbi:MAG: hypothetical protein NT113_13290 [Hyphomicrobiales bacterium]|nr:hypothetical protein [Hyphomicrobiales bacterium]